ncbi:hypothetical protein SAMD00019534_124950 [Acytostelium subglobosum LB1]|uniref:hypothetical protein n=1 Tax=Acytostelium subglobosum LB1 TaxID=1410327 RepID=UPI000644F89D|nr:hypothetical protein SAMD00019534_124950 [Acytostelium subglobosum LB1]GAM29319.1 hypothetical protein SAMD00019534_124950 [Acytostelium subglobosum LB1]|eukprot:XP_012747746.1 hypothetical protein SAMD00019534_124950 [Acytostelium subglobosum LB1]
MNSQQPDKRYNVQYTNQKHKKQKQWFEGSIVCSSTKITLIEADTKKTLDSKFRNSSMILDDDVELETDGYIIRIISSEQKSSSSCSSASTLRTSKQTSQTIATRPTTGKRKGFTVPTGSGNALLKEATPPIHQSSLEVNNNNNNINKSNEEDDDTFVYRQPQGHRQGTELRKTRDININNTNNNTNNNIFNDESNVSLEPKLTYPVQHVRVTEPPADSRPSQPKSSLLGILSSLNRLAAPAQSLEVVLQPTATVAPDSPKQSLVDDFEFDYSDQTVDNPDDYVQSSVAPSSTALPLPKPTLLTRPLLLTTKSQTSTQLVSTSGGLKRKPFAPLHPGQGTVETPPPKSLRSKLFNSPGSLNKKGNNNEPDWSPDSIVFPDAKTCENLYLRGTIDRNRTIVNSFESIDSYQQCFVMAIQEELNIRLVELAHNFYKSCINLNTSSSNPKCEHGPTIRLVTRMGANKGKEYFKCAAPRNRSCNFFQFLGTSQLTMPPIVDNHIVNLPTGDRCEEVEQIFNNRGISLYMSADLYVKEERIPTVSTDTFTVNSNSQQQPTQPKISYFLKFQKKKYQQYSKDDLWILSTNSNFSINPFIVRSIFHGPSQLGMIEVKPIGDIPEKLSRVNKVFAIQAMNASTELSMIDNLQSSILETLPISSTLLDPTKETVSNNDTYDKFYMHITIEEGLALANEFIDKYSLNEHQSRVLMECFKWFNFIDSEKENYSQPVLLVHGVFGSGKSTLLVVIILFIDRLCELGDNHLIRVLVSSLTNVAVDRILLGLLQYGFDNFNRIGSVKKIAKPILLYILKSGGTLGGRTDLDTEIINDLKSMLKTETLSEDERTILQETIESIKSGSTIKRKDLGKSRVVGATCNSSLFSSLDGQEFPILFLDECSQMQEPLSLLPICRSKCHRLVAVGDPMQLEPTIHSKPSEQLIKSGGGLEKTLFVRLSAMNVKPILLRTQYRCHPVISNLSNHLFYSGMLNDGIMEVHRQALVNNLPPILFVESDSGSEALDNFGSYFNEDEVSLVMSIIEILMNNGIKESQIGVICLYKAQALKIQLKYKEMREKTKKNVSNMSTNDPFVEFEWDNFDDDPNQQASEEEDIDGKQSEEIKISTVDAFQGAERDIIILSCSRTTQAYGFVDNNQRLNVAITRAKHHLLIVGRSLTLVNNEKWKTIIRSAKCTVSGRTLVKSKQFYASTPNE